MKIKNPFLFLILTTFATFSLPSSSWASLSNRISYDKMHIDGEIPEEDIPDEETLMLDKEINKNSKTLKGFTQKGKKYDKLKNVVEKMSEKHLEYVEHKLEYEDVVGQFNKQVECVQNPNGPDCKNILPGRQKSKKDKSREANRDQGRAYGQEIQRVMLYHLPVFKGCYQKELDLGKSPYKGSLMVEMAVDERGRVEYSKLVDSPNVVSPSLGQCLVRGLNSLQFPSHAEGKTFRIRQPLNFYYNEDI